MFTQWLKKWTSRQHRTRESAPARRRSTRRPGLEVLEDRAVPAVLTVNSLADGVDHTDGSLTLREALGVVNSQSTAGLMPAELAQVNTGTPLGTNDTIEFSVTGTLRLTSGAQLELQKAVTISGPGKDLLNISGDANADGVHNTGDVRLFNVNDRDPFTMIAVTITDLSMTGGFAQGQGGFGQGKGGGAIHNLETLAVTRCTLDNNQADGFGGAIDGTSAPLTVTDCTLSNNSAVECGGAIAVEFTHFIGNDNIEIIGSTISNNRVRIAQNSPTLGGGAIFSLGKLRIVNSTLSGNSSEGQAGAIYKLDGSLTVIGSTITGNRSDSDGGGIVMRRDGSRTLYNTIVAGNFRGTGTTADDIQGENTLDAASANNLIGDAASAGGLINGSNGNKVGVDPLLGPLAYHGGPTQTHALLPGSPALGAGDPALVPGGVTTDHAGAPFARVVGGKVDAGAYQAQSLSLVVSTTVDEEDGDYGPGHLSLREAVSLANVNPGEDAITFDPTVFATAQTITLTKGPLVLTDMTGATSIVGPAAGVTVSGVASGVFRIDSGVTASLSGLTVTRGSVGGIHNQGTLTLSGCTLSGNSSVVGGGLSNLGTATLTNCTLSGNSAFQGGGIANFGTLALTNCTLSGNSAPDSGGGIINYAGFTTLNNTIVANSAGADVYVFGGFVSGSHNLIEDGSGGLADTLTGDPLLAPLGNYGGPTRTHALLPGSPAINRGAAAPAADQRGLGRVGAVDLGAFESQGFALAVASGNNQFVTLGTTAFAPLVVQVTANNSLEPVDGGKVDFFASARVTLSGSPATISGGKASVTATANAAGNHTVAAAASGASGALFTLTSIDPPSSLNGFVWEDFNDDGQIDFGERGISGVTVKLQGTDDLGHDVDLTATTDSNGFYQFTGLHSGGYHVTATKPAGYSSEGKDSVGTVNGVPTGSVSGADQFFIDLAAGADAMNYNFGERPPAGGGVTSGQTAGIGFWNNKHGQALIRSLNGGPTSTQLGNWLAATFANVFGAAVAGGNDLTGKTNAEVAAIFQQKFMLKGMKLDAQVMATALSVYVTNQTLAGDTAAAYGFEVSQDGVGARMYGVGSKGAAFGVANNSSVSVLDLLLAVNARSRNGLLYDLDGSGQISGSEAALRSMANDLFSALNAAGSI